MATATIGPIGPIGLLARGDVRDAAFSLGISVEECRGALSSSFRFTGETGALRKLVSWFKEAEADIERQEHARYVADMERAEKRRAKWGFLLGRHPRVEHLTRAEADEVFLLLCETLWDYALEATDDAGARRDKGMKILAPLLDDKDPARDYAIGTLAAVRMRYLQHDVRTGGMKISKGLSRRILAMRVPMDTWDD